jgi:hypothetical protein
MARIKLMGFNVTLARILVMGSKSFMARIREDLLLLIYFGLVEVGFTENIMDVRPRDW